MAVVGGIAYAGDTYKELELVCDQIANPHFTEAVKQAYEKCKPIKSRDLWFHPQPNPLNKKIIEAWVVIDMTDKSCALPTIARLESELEAREGGEQIMVMSADEFLSRRS